MFGFGGKAEAKPPPPQAASSGWRWGGSKEASAAVPPMPEPKRNDQWFGGAFNKQQEAKREETSTFFGGQAKPPPRRIDRAAQAVGLQEKEPTAYDTVCDALGCDKIPYKYRVGGWLACLAIAFVLSIGTLVLITAVLAGRPEEFVVPFTFSHIISITGSMLLSTPKVFCRTAFDKYHWGASTIYFLTIILTLFVVFYEGIPDDGRVAVIVLCMITQYLAYIWFCISQIPFAARVQKAWCRSMCGCDKCVGFFP